jgi:acetyl-CoA carboxylase carboxyl transferase subunit alpha
MMHGWEFERPIAELEKKIEELRRFSKDKNLDLSAEIGNLSRKLQSLRKNVYSNLSAWQKIQIARHPQRPTVSEYISLIMKDFLPICGDRLFGDDRALLAGFARLDEINVAVLGHQKGRDTKENIERNFGCAHPEGYRKAMRLMRLAERFRMPIISLVDTPGAYPGIGAEERGQAQAIAENIRDMFSLTVPIIVTVIGEGGSGGALGVGVGDVVMMMEYAYYSVISPEGCAAILWKDASKKEEAARVLKLTAPDLLKLGVVDEVIPEPEGGAHRSREEAARNLKEALLKRLTELKARPRDVLVDSRYEKFRKMGVFAQ